MPTSVVTAAIGATISGSTIAAGVISWGFSVNAFIGSMVMSGLSAALAPSAPEQSASSITSAGRTVTVRQAITPWRVVYGRTRVGGAVTYKKVTGGKIFYHMVITLAGHVCEEIESVYFNDEEVPLDGTGDATGRYAGLARIIKSLGDESGQPFPDLVTESGGEWTDAHRQTGHTKIYVRLRANSDLFASGVPNITCIVKGKNDILDPRTSLRGWTDNPALIVADYLCDTVRGLGCDYAAELDAVALAASANVCDEAVTLAAGGSEARYTCNGAYSATEKPVDLLPKLASSMAGYVVKIGATWDVVAGAYETPTVELTQSDLAGPIAWQALVSRRESCNAVKGVYAAPDNFWQPTDFPAVASAAYLALDNDEPAYHDLKLDYTDSGTMAQRIAKIDLERTRQGLTVSFPGKLTAFRAKPGSTIMLTLDKYGWSAKPFFVEEGRFSIGADGALGYHLSLRETAAAVYDWSTADEQVVDIAPNTDLGDPFTVATPGTPTVTESLYETTGSAGVKSRATVSWVRGDDAMVVDDLLEYRPQSGTWTERPAVTGSADTLDDLAPGIYEFRVRSRNGLGVRSEYSGTRTQEILGLTVPPADVAGLVVIARAGMAHADWTLHTDLDVRIGGGIVIRHSPLASDAAWEDGIVLREFPGGAVGGTLPLLSGTYMAKAQDSSGNWSSGIASFYASETMVTGWTTVSTVTEHPTFGGTKTDVAVSGGALQLDSATPVDSMAGTIDTWDSIDAIGGIEATGSYTFTSTLDLTTVATRNFLVGITAVSFDTGDLIDSRTTEIDYWDDMAGAVVNDCDVTPYIRTTPDDPAGSPTWSAWMPFYNIDARCRAAQFRLDFQSGARSHNIAVSALQVTARIPS